MKFLVYGTLKRKHGNNRILRDGGAVYLGRAVTLGKFAMGGLGVPFVWPAEAGHQLIGELWDIGDVDGSDAGNAAATLHRLDSLESNGRVYERKQHSVRIIENAQGIKPLPRDAGDVHEGVWIYEAMDHISRDFYADELQEPNAEGFVEWRAERERA